MVNSLDLTKPEIDNLTLATVYQQINLDKQSEIPLIIKLVEHPSSPIALPGKISLRNHDCLHIVFGIGVSSQDEAFILGFTMGNDDSTKQWHVGLFKLLSRFVYPLKYRFTVEDLNIFDRGFEYGIQLKYRNINQLNFEWFYDVRISALRLLLGIDRQNISLF